MFDLFTMFFLVQLFFLHLYYIHISKNNTIFIYIMMGIFYIILYLSFFALQYLTCQCAVFAPPLEGVVRNNRTQIIVPPRALSPVPTARQPGRCFQKSICWTPASHP